MRKRKSSPKQVRLCAFCRSPHRVYEKKGIGLGQILASLLLTLCLMAGLWGHWNAKAIPIWLISLFVIEVMVHFRWRLALICRQCGFDPLIYKKNQQEAAQRVKLFLDRRKRDPRFLTAPPLNLPKKRDGLAGSTFNSSVTP